MRYAPLLLAVLLAGCYTTASDLPPAGPAPAPMKAANTIVIQTSDSAKVAYRKMAQLLQREGYSLTNTDESLLSMTTDWISYTGNNNRLRVSAFVGTPDSIESGSTVTVKAIQRLAFNMGQALVGEAAAEDAGSSVENSGQGGSPMQEAFGELKSLAEAYPNGQLLYYRNP